MVDCLFLYFCSFPDLRVSLSALSVLYPRSFSSFTLSYSFLSRWLTPSTSPSLRPRFFLGTLTNILSNHSHSIRLIQGFLSPVSVSKSDLSFKCYRLLTSNFFLDTWRESLKNGSHSISLVKGFPTRISKSKSNLSIKKYQLFTLLVLKSGRRGLSRTLWHLPHIVLDPMPP
jgi:hypothetical protein